MDRANNCSNCSSLYDMRLNPPYLVDFTSSCSGKHVSVAKRRVRFRFGFSNADAISRGETGTDCRGREHELTLVWSHTSGKKLLLADDQEVHFSVGKPTQTKFHFSWTMQGGHVLKITAHATSPLKAKPGWRQFDLQLDGQSVFDMPRIFELGVTTGAGSSVVPRVQDQENQSYNNYTIPDDEYFSWTHCVGEHEARRDLDLHVPYEEDYYFERQQQVSLAAPAEQNSSDAQAYNLSSDTSSDTPVPPLPHSSEGAADLIVFEEQTAGHMANPMNTVGNYSDSANSLDFCHSGDFGAGGAPLPPVRANSSEAISEFSPRGVHEVLRAENICGGMDKKLPSLVNLNDLNQSYSGVIPAMNPFDNTKHDARTRSLPPTSDGWAMSGKTLDELKTSVGTEGDAAPKREIMKSWNTADYSRAGQADGTVPNGRSISAPAAVLGYHGYMLQQQVAAQRMPQQPSSYC